MARPAPTRRRTEHGAVAVLTAIVLTFVLIPVAALTVDLGNAWARQRMLQRQVDVSALSAGHLLPRSSTNQTAIATEVASYLNRTANRVKGQSVPTTTAAGLLDGVTTNGEITFPDSDGSRMRVVAPQARVDYGLAGFFGVHSKQVRAEATVDLFGGLPPKEDVMPMWLPSGCVYGPGTGDTSSHSAAAAATATATATSTATASATPSPYVPPENTQNGFTVAAVSNSPMNQGSTSNVTVSLSGLPNNSTNGSIRFAYDSRTVGVATAVSWAQTSNSSDSRTVTINVNTNVTSTPGTWSVYGLVTSGNSQKVTENHASFVVTPTAPASTATATPTPMPTATSAPSSSCSVSEVGNFGQLDSPRAGVNQLQTRLAMNTALGVDHNLVPWSDSSPPSSNNCGQSSPSITGAQLDDTVREGNNCVDVQQGNDGGALTDGLITGGAGFKGRLDASNTDGHTTCPSRSDVSVKGTTVNNDVLSCFLRGGATLDTIATPGGPDAVSQTWLDPAVVKSPRFVWVPVVYAGNRASHQFQALKTYVPAFITDEHMVNGSLVPATNDNGVTLNNGGQQVESVQLFSFNPNILPLNLRSPDQTYDPNQRYQVRLVN